jgi:MoxR-like ATPase
MEPAREASNAMIAAFEQAADALARARSALRGVVFGQDRAVELALAAAVAGGWATVAGGPGSGRTRLVQALGRVLGLKTGRILFDPQLELDTLVETPEGPRSVGPDGRRRAAEAPLFSQLVLADDFDRASPRLRTALMEAAHDGSLMVGGQRVALPRPFLLFATGGRDGLIGLDETEADRFLLQIDMGAPDRDGERRMLIETASREIPPSAVMDVPALLAAQRVAVELPVGERVVEAMLDIVRRARPDDPSAPTIVKSDVARGPGPRAGQALMRLARAAALADGRAAPSVADVRTLAPAVLAPRLQMAERHGKRLDPAPVIEALVEGLR